jgi:hypothetical protein
MAITAGGGREHGSGLGRDGDEHENKKLRRRKKDISY